MTVTKYDVLFNVLHLMHAFAVAPAPTFIRLDRMSGTVSRLPLLEFLLAGYGSQAA